MSELGARLRQARESQGLSLAQASVDTRILQQSLIALEEGAYQRLPGDVVIRGFIRNYAQYLGLAADEMIEIYRRERGVTDKIRVVAATTPPRSRSYVLPSFFGVFFVTIALVGLAYVALNAVGRIGDRASVAAAPPTATIPPPSPLPSPTLGRAPAVVVPTRAPTSIAALSTAGPVGSASGQTAQPTAASTGGPTVQSMSPTPRPAGGVNLQATPTTIVITPQTGRLTPTPAAPIVVEVRISSQNGGESSWLRVQADGNTIYEGTMSAGQRQVFQAQRRILIRAGNPPAVLVTVNGLEQGPLGQVPGQPVNWPWPPN